MKTNACYVIAAIIGLMNDVPFIVCFAIMAFTIIGTAIHRYENEEWEH